jgi:ribonuclease P protein component
VDNKKARWIASLRQNGKEAASQFVFLRYMKGACQEPQAAYIVSKKVGTSVVRNRVKRRLRELFRTRIGAMVPPGRYLFIARGAIVGARWDQIETDLIALVKRIS